MAKKIRKVWVGILIQYASPGQARLHLTHGPGRIVHNDIHLAGPAGPLG